jgi:hypothetical protein
LDAALGLFMLAYDCWKGKCGYFFVLSQGFIFKLEEEVKSALLLLLPGLYAESAVFELASGLGCMLVVAIAQAPMKTT